MRDLGTRFGVDLRPERVSVVVLEGSVAISTPEAGPVVLGDGQRLSYTPSGTRSPAEAADLESATAWLDGQLIFKNRPLGEVVAEMARYHDIDMALLDDDLQTLEVNGTFKVRNLDQFLKSLESSQPLGASGLPSRRGRGVDSAHRFDLERFEHGIIRGQGQAFDLRLRGQHSVEGIAMGVLPRTRELGMARADG